MLIDIQAEALLHWLGAAPDIDDGVKVSIQPFQEAGLLAVKEVNQEVVGRAKAECPQHVSVPERAAILVEHQDLAGIVRREQVRP